MSEKRDVTALPIDGGESPCAFRETILAMQSPIAQRYTFARYVLGEDWRSAAAIAGQFQDVGLMDEREYDVVLVGWTEE